MSAVPSLKNESISISISMFIDWCKYKNIFYNNVYLEEYDWTIKMPLIPKRTQKEFKLKKFDLTKYTYLLSY
ncbi:MAG: hypothetical protein KGD67_07895 [Candidatus Lokiarchaeota archaeon]|jgi:hypothetical protein|nr:hypothetical protein [Candidatus Lokiarchaeota archaeon]